MVDTLMHDLARGYEALLRAIDTIIMRLATLPYYRFFDFNTRQPLIRIAACANDSSNEGQRRLVKELSRWHHNKEEELRFVFLASGLIGAALVSAFSWQNVDTAYWLTSVFWSVGLVLSVLGLIMSAQQLAVLRLLGDPTKTAVGAGSGYEMIERYRPLLMTNGPLVRLPGVEYRRGQWRPRRKMIFMWAGSIMLMSYAVVLLLAGISTYVCTPLLNGEWPDTGAITGVVYLVAAAGAVSVYGVCTFWIYRYVEIPA